MLEKEKPPLLGLIQRDGQVVLRMLPNVKQKTINPIIEAMVSKGTIIYTEEYSIYARLPMWGPPAQDRPSQPRRAYV
jgi:transposase